MSFYKLNSSEEPESIHQPIMEEDGPNDANFNINDIPSEDPGLKQKVRSLKSYKSMKTPFRTLSQEPSMFETFHEDVQTRKESCEVSFSESKEEPAERVPRIPSLFKASMLYIKQTSRRF